MGYRVLHCADAFWRPSNFMGGELVDFMYPDGPRAMPPELAALDEDGTG